MFVKAEQYQKDIERVLDRIPNLSAMESGTVLITGATGTVGSAVADLLLCARMRGLTGIKLMVAARNQDFVAKELGEVDGVQVVSYDMEKSIHLAGSVDYIIHATGYGNPGAFAENPVGVIRTNVHAMEEILEYARTQVCKRVLFVSTGEVYGNVDITSSRACYPESKRLCETLCAAYGKQYGVDAVIARLCHTFGPVIREKDDRAHAEFLKKASRGEDIVLKSKGEQLRSYAYALDAAGGILTTLLNGEKGEAVDICGDETISIAGLAELIAESAGTKVRMELPDEKDLIKKSPISSQVLNPQRLQKLGYRSIFSIREGIAHTLQAMSE